MLIYQSGWAAGNAWPSESSPMSSHKDHCEISEGNYTIKDKFVTITYSDVEKLSAWRPLKSYDFHPKTVQFDFKPPFRKSIDLCSLAYETSGLVNISIDDGTYRFEVEKGSDRYNDRYYNPRYANNNCNLKFKGIYDVFLSSHNCNSITLELENENVKVFCKDGDRKMELNLALLRLLGTYKFKNCYKEFMVDTAQWDGPEKQARDERKLSNCLGFVKMDKSGFDADPGKALSSLIFKDPAPWKRYNDLKDLGCDPREGRKSALIEVRKNRCDNRLSLCYRSASETLERSKQTVTFGKDSSQKVMNSESDRCHAEYLECKAHQESQNTNLIEQGDSLR